MRWPFRRNLAGLALIADELKLERDVLHAEKMQMIDMLQRATRELENQRKENGTLVRENAILKARLAIEDPPERPMTGVGQGPKPMSGSIIQKRLMEYLDKNMAFDVAKVDWGMLAKAESTRDGVHPGPKGTPYPLTPEDQVKIGKLPKLGGDDGV